MQNAKKKKFRPTKVPRYLPGSVTKDFNRADLKEYNKHRYNIFSAEAKVDARPLIMNPHSYYDRRKVMVDAQRLNLIDNDNKLLLKKINIINRTKGRLDTYNPVAYAKMSKWNHHVQKMKRIEGDNREIYKNLTSVYSMYSRTYMEKEWQRILEKIRYTAKFPLVIWQKDLDDNIRRMPSISGGLSKLAERPLCFLEFKVVQTGRILGKIIVELYHDHVPVTVQNFLGICRGENNLTYKGCKIHRIVPGNFFETGDITKGTGKGGFSIYGETFDEESHLLKHSRPGVLSMKRIGFEQRNNSQFCVTLDKLEQLDKKNVVFGKVIKGAETIFNIQGYGRRVGKPLADVIISNCGEYRTRSKK